MKLTSISKNSIVASLKYFLCLPIAFVFYKKQKGVWIISERPDQARDNGYIFFKYMREKHPTQRVYYLIDKGAQDYKKIEEYGNVIQINSWKHYLYYCLSKVHISAHVNGCCPDGAIGISRRTKKKVGIFFSLLYPVHIVGQHGFRQFLDFCERSALLQPRCVVVI